MPKDFSNSIRAMAYTENTFEAFVSGLELPAVVEKDAKSLLKDIFTFFKKNTSEIQVNIWIACSIYIAVQNFSLQFRLGGLVDKSHTYVTVSQLLYRANINIMDFFHAMCFLKSNFPLSSETKQNFIALERKYCIVSALYDKFEKMLNDIFSVESATQGNHLDELLNHYKSLCWTLFLVAKAKVLWHRQELLATFHLLLCCVAEVINAAPTFLLLPPFDNIVTTTNNTLNVLEVLSEVISTSINEVKIVYDYWLHAAEELMPDSTLLELAELKAKYTDQYLQSGDLDESKFLEKDWHIIPKGADSNSPKKASTVSVSSTLEASQALGVILQSAPNTLSRSLKELFKLCSRSPSNLINTFVSCFRYKFVTAFEHANGNSDSVVGEKRCESAIKYYYLMLDAIVRKEAARLSIGDLTAFLHNEIFHQSLLACCTEVVLMSCGSLGPLTFTPGAQGNNSDVQGIVFPWVLKVFEVKAYHFFKIIDTFIKTSPAITQQIITHLKNIENKIMQTLAWVSDSPIFVSSTGVKKFSDSNEASKNLLSVPNSSASTSKHESLSLSPGVNIFYNKVSRYAYRRVEMLCFLLKLDEDILKDIWICMEHVIYSKSYILKDRYLDQIIMCCIYAVCRVREQNILFKSIISEYNLLPDASESVYKQILQSGKKEYIISFYNNTFASEMKGFVTNQFTSESGNSLLSNAALSPLTPSFSIVGRRNIFVSPLKKSPFKNPNEIILQASPANDSSNQAKKCHGENETLKTASSSHKIKDDSKVTKRLRFDQDSTVEDQNNGEKCSLASVKKYLKFDD